MTSNTEQIVETPRLLLEPLLPKHAAALYQGLQDQRLYKYVAMRPPLSAAALRRRFRDLSSRHSPDGNDIWLNWAIRLRDGRYVGWLQAGVHKDCSSNIAYIVFPMFWRRGYAKEACQALLTHLVRNHKVTRVAATVDTKNIASIRLLESLGFTQVSTAVALDFHDLHHEHRYEMLLKRNGVRE